MRWARWFLLAMGCFQLLAASVVYVQGKQISEKINRDAYGSFFWNGVDVERFYSGWEIKAEERFSTAMLYSTLGLLGCFFGFLVFFGQKHQAELLETIERLKREPADNINSEPGSSA